jgi:hypothetical protein
MCDLFDEAIFEAKLRRLATGFQRRFGDLLKYNVEEEIATYKVGKRAASAHHGRLTLYLGSSRKARPVCRRSDPPPRLGQGEERKDLGGRRQRADAGH